MANVAIYDHHDSSDDDDMDGMMMFPLTDIDHDADIEDGSGDSPGSDGSGDDHSAKKSDFPLPKPAFSLRQRRRSKLGIQGEFSKLNLNLNLSNVSRVQSTDSGFDESHSENNSASVGSPKVTAIWLKALKKIKTIKDPWEEFHIENFEEEKCTRFRYNALKKEWKTDTVRVKMQKQVCLLIE